MAHPPRPETWVRGLVIHHSAYRYRRTIKGKLIFRSLGKDYAQAVLAATRINLELEGYLPPHDIAFTGGVVPVSPVLVSTPEAAAHRSDLPTFKSFALDTWLKQKQSVIAPRTFRRYRAIINTFCNWPNQRKTPDLTWRKPTMAFALTILPIAAAHR